jgi:ATP-dependent DNA helicase RecQ
MRGVAEVRLRQPAVRKKDSRPAVTAARPAFGEVMREYDRGLFEALRTWRREEAQGRGVPPYIIFNDRTLRELARIRPTTLIELRAVHGIGDAKLEAFGRAVIEVIRGTLNTDH